MNVQKQYLYLPSTTEGTERSRIPNITSDAGKGGLPAS